MSSVYNIVVCPQCGGCYETEFDCTTYEESKFCHRCGKQESNSSSSPEDTHFGFGCLCITDTNGIRCLYSLSKPLTKISLLKIKREIKSKHISVDECYLTKWDEGKNDVVAVFGDIPPTYAEEFGL